MTAHTIWEDDPGGRTVVGARDLEATGVHTEAGVQSHTPKRTCCLSGCSGPGLPHASTLLGAPPHPPVWKGVSLCVFGAGPVQFILEGGVWVFGPLLILSEPLVL